MRERQVSKESGSGTVRDGLGSSQRDAEYAVGKRTEQLMSPAGRVKQIHVAAVITVALDAEQLAHAQSLLTAAVGASPERGDVVVIQVAPSLKPATRQSTEGVVSDADMTASDHPSELRAPSQMVQRRWPRVLIGVQSATAFLSQAHGWPWVFLPRWLCCWGGSPGGMQPLTKAESAATRTAHSATSELAAG